MQKFKPLDNLYPQYSMDISEDRTESCAITYVILEPGVCVKIRQVITGSGGMLINNNEPEEELHKAVEEHRQWWDSLMPEEKDKEISQNGDIHSIPSRQPRCLVKDHAYELPLFEDPSQVAEIQFIHKKNLPGTSELVTVRDGITNEQLLEVLINRMKGLNNKFPCKENACAITHLEESLMWMYKRTEDREFRGVEGKHVK